MSDAEGEKVDRWDELVERMWGVWNERDVEKVRAGIDAVFSPEVEFIDPHYAIVGRPAFEEMVRTFRGRFPEAICSLSSGIDAHHGLLRYHWEIHLGERFLIEGFDVTELDETGQIKRVLGFFGPIQRGPVPGHSSSA